MITFGFGPEIYTSTSMRKPNDNRIEEGQNYDKTNTPMFEFSPGYNRIIVSGNELRKDSWLYVEEIPITY